MDGILVGIPSSEMSRKHVPGTPREFIIAQAAQNFRYASERVQAMCNPGLSSPSCFSLTHLCCVRYGAQGKLC